MGRDGGVILEKKLHAVVARRCAKHMSKSKCTKHTMLGPLLEVEMSKSARRCGAKRTDHFWALRCRFAWKAQGSVHLVKSEQNVSVF